MGYPPMILNPKGHKKVVEALLDNQEKLVSSYNDKTGWFPIHTAAFHKQLECLNVLIKYKANVMEPTRESEMSANCFTPIHLVTDKKIQRKTTRSNVQSF